MAENWLSVPSGSKLDDEEIKFWLYYFFVVYKSVQQFKSYEYIAKMAKYLIS